MNKNGDTSHVTRPEFFFLKTNRSHALPNNLKVLKDSNYKSLRLGLLEFSHGSAPETWLWVSVA